MRVLALYSESAPHYLCVAASAARYRALISGMGVEVETCRWPVVPMTPFETMEEFDAIHLYEGLAPTPFELHVDRPIVVSLSPGSGRHEFGSPPAPTLAANRYILESQKESSDPSVRTDAQGVTSLLPIGVDTDWVLPIARRAAREQLGWHATKKTVALPAEFKADGKSAQEIRAVVAQVSADLKIPVQLIFLSEIGPEQLPVYLNAADALLWPTGQKDVSLAGIVEAMACNVPVVAAGELGVQELLDGVDGNCICEARIDAMAEATGQILCMPRHSSGRQRILERKFTLHETARRMAEIYLSLS